MLSSQPKQKGQKQKGQQKQKNQQDNQGDKKQKDSVFVPPKFHGVLGDVDHVLVQNPKTFEIPFGVPIDEIFNVIRGDLVIDLEKILKSDYKLTNKLYTDKYVHGILAIYYGNLKAIQEFRNSIVTTLQTIVVPQTIASNVRGTAVYLKNEVKLTTDVFIRCIRESIDEELIKVYADKFDADDPDKPNAILSLNMQNWINTLLKKLINISSKPGGAIGGRTPTADEKANLDKMVADWKKLTVGSDEHRDLGQRIKDERNRIYDEPEPAPAPAPTSSSKYPRWDMSLNTQYKKGDRVSWMGIDYEYVSDTLGTEMPGQLGKYNFQTKTPIPPLWKKVTSLASTPITTASASTTTTTTPALAAATPTTTTTPALAAATPTTTTTPALAAATPTTTTTPALAAPPAGPKQPTVVVQHPRCGRFEHQDSPLSCGRHALNNLFGEEKFIKSDPATNPRINLDNPTFPVSLPHLCKKLSIEAKKLGLGNDMFECEDSENYTIETMKYAIYHAGKDVEGYPVAELTKLVSYLESESEFSMIINLGSLSKPGGMRGGLLTPEQDKELKDLKSQTNLSNKKKKRLAKLEQWQKDPNPPPTSTTTTPTTTTPTSTTPTTPTSTTRTVTTKGLHWVAAKSTGFTHCYYDSLKNTPTHFDSKDDLIDYIVGLNALHFLIIKDSDVPINAKTKLRESASPVVSIKPEENIDVLRKFLEEFKDKYSKEFTQFVDTIKNKYTLETLQGGGGEMVGGRYTGQKYVTSKPIDTPNLTSPTWYPIPPKSMNNITPLQYAIGYGGVATVRVLIENGADFTVSTLDGITLQNLANSRKANDTKAKDVKELLKFVYAAYSAARSDFDRVKMKDDYVAESNLKGDELREKSLLNKVYERTYKTIKSGKPLVTTLGEAGEKAKKKGIEDGFKGVPEDKDQTVNNPSKDVKDGYLLGYEIGKAKAAGTADGQAGATSPRNQFYENDPTIPEEVKKAYKEAFEKANGANIYKGFKDGVTGKKPVPPGEAFLKFDDEFSNILQLGKTDQKATDQYKIAYNLGLDIFYQKIPELINNARNNGTLDKYDGNSKYTRKDIIKTKPLLGGIVNYAQNVATGFSNETRGEDEETFEVEYDKLDLEPKYAQIRSIIMDPSITVPSKATAAGNAIAYGAYIKILYDKGYEEGKPKSAGSKTYRRSHKGKNRTYKKKLGRK